MCGIAGIFAYHYAAPVIDRDELRLIRDHMRARGPDGKGQWLSQNGRVGLAHRRLAIIDLSDEAAQPMVSADQRLVISFNGEIYNYQALRQTLEQKGCRFRTQSDTEVLLHLYADKGEAMLQELRGMFAFALWDANKKAMLLARDPYGIKPLYYADDGWTLRLASQVKALQAGNKISRQAEPAGIVGFYLFGSVPEPYTLYQEIHSVPAGSYVWVNDCGPDQAVQYFSIARIWQQAEQNPLQTNDRAVIAGEALRDSVRHHQVADVPVGAFLSSGIDSGALVGLMAESEPESLHSICLAFSEFKGQAEDESPLAAQLARQYHTEHHTRYVDEAEFHQDLPKILEAMDQPSIDGINTWFVAKAAREQGLKVAVSGLGGDELFGGYPSFQDIPKWVRQLWLPAHIPGLACLTEQIQNIFTPLFADLNPKAKGLIRYGGHYAGAYLLRRGLFLPNELSQLLDADVVKEGLQRLQPLSCIQNAMGDTRTAYGRIAALESILYMRNQLLRDSDWAGMAHSLEIRVPLVDSVLLQKLAPILIHGLQNKTLLAKTPVKPLPETISERAKTGFTTPIEQWLQKNDNTQQWQDVAILNSPSCPWARRWAYTTLNCFNEHGVSLD